MNKSKEAVEDVKEKEHDYDCTTGELKQWQNISIVTEIATASDGKATEKKITFHNNGKKVTSNTQLTAENDQDYYHCLRMIEIWLPPVTFL
jgi:hypothetical protein